MPLRVSLPPSLCKVSRMRINNDQLNVRSLCQYVVWQKQSTFLLEFPVLHILLRSLPCPSVYSVCSVYSCRTVEINNKQCQTMNVNCATEHQRVKANWDFKRQKRLIKFLFHSAFCVECTHTPSGWQRLSSVEWDRPGEQNKGIWQKGSHSYMPHWWFVKSATESLKAFPFHCFTKSFETCALLCLHLHCRRIKIRFIASVIHNSLILDAYRSASKVTPHPKW